MHHLHNCKNAIIKFLENCAPVSSLFLMVKWLQNRSLVPKNYILYVHMYHDNSVSENKSP